MKASIHSLTRAQVRDLDQRSVEEFGVPGIVLMENAGRGAAEVLLQLGVSGSVHVICRKELSDNDPIRVGCSTIHLNRDANPTACDGRLGCRCTLWHRPGWASQITLRRHH